MIIVSFDMGSVNLACSVIKVNDKTGVKQLVSASMIPVTIRDIKKYDSTMVKEFLSYVEQHIKELKVVDCVVFERFMTRGLISGTTMESCNIMIGLLSGLFLTINTNTIIRVIPASQWKNALSFNLNIFYKLCAVEKHIIDSFFIGLYQTSVNSGRSSSYKELMTIIKCLERTAGVNRKINIKTFNENKKRLIKSYDKLPVSKRV